MSATESLALELMLFGCAGGVYLIAGALWHAFVRRPQATRIRKRA